MHIPDEAMTRLAKLALTYAFERIHMDPPPLDGPRSYTQLWDEVGQTITPDGLGTDRAFRTYMNDLAPYCISVDHPRHLSFVPAAPSEASVIFDMVVSASGVYGGSWLEASGAVYAENQVLRWLADLAGFPASAGGAFVSGGTAGNLSALIAARHRWRARADGRHDRTRGLMVASRGAHSSVAQAARAMDCDVLDIPVSGDGHETAKRSLHRVTGDNLRRVIDSLPHGERERIFAIVATGGTTNVGVVDELEAIGTVANELGTWFHVDGAYGVAALCAPSARHLFSGIERADSFIVDPHKWLFAPYDSCALVYRDIHDGRRAHTQHAEYLDVLHGDHPGDHPGDHSTSAGPWFESNPADVAHHLSRRVRGLPLWFGLAVHGTTAYAEAVEISLRVTRDCAREIQSRDYLELLLEPQLSILVFKRRGWTAEQYQQWSDEQLHAGRAFVTPTSLDGEPILRFCIVNPRTTIDDLVMILDSLRDDDDDTL
ncbi:MAG: pyridoxal phosphate-dependent decarboxylase family protein [Ilumatobacteraceae bacterium]